MDRDSVEIAVTGIGVVSSIGVGREAFWTNLIAGRSGIAPIGSFRVAEGAPRLAAEVRDFTPKEYIAATHLRRMDRLSRLVVAASRLACDDAGLESAAGDVGVVVGSAFGNVTESMQHIDRVLDKGPAFASPMIFPNLVHNTPASYVAMELGCTSANLTVSHGEASGECAVALGCDLIRNGRAPMVLAGAGDEFAPLVYEILCRARALSSQDGGPEWSSPYDVGRNGVVLGEGAAVLLLEPLSAAIARGARAYALIGGAVFSLPAARYGIPQGIDAAVREWRRLSPDAFPDLVCGAGNSTVELDAWELEAVAGLGAGEQPWLTSIRGAIGDFGSSGALQVAAAAMAVAAQQVPPLCHLVQPEPAPGLRLAEKAGRAVPIRQAMVSGIARGGAAAAVCLRRSTLPLPAGLI